MRSKASVVVLIFCSLVLFSIFGKHGVVQAVDEELLTKNYRYTIEVTVPKLNTFLIFPLNKLARTKLRLTYPLNWPGTELYIDSSSRKPDAFEFGPEWAQNQYMTYLIPTDEDQQIKITGRIKLTALNLDQLAPQKEAYETYSLNEMRKYSLYVQPSLLVDSNNPVIIEAAAEIRGNKTLLKDVVSSTYEYVVKNIDYNDLSLDIRDRFYIPQRASETLINGSGVCIDYSRLMVALLRAQGIPARLVVGAVNLPEEKSASLNLHAWVQFLIPNSALIDIDPTWGENGQKYISDIDADHIRIQFSLPGDKDNIELFDFYQPYYIDNPILFLLNGKMPDSYMNFSEAPISESDSKTDDIEDIHSLTNVFISADEGYLNPLPDTVKYLIYTYITDPMKLFAFQTIVLFIASLKLFFIFLRRRYRKNKRR